MKGATEEVLVRLDGRDPDYHAVVDFLVREAGAPLVPLARWPLRPGQAVELGSRPACVCG